MKSRYPEFQPRMIGGAQTLPSLILASPLLQKPTMEKRMMVISHRGHHERGSKRRSRDNLN
ncbi:hypothetical protein DAPPUDRAFT_233010 [Daphnia pulex]|uniref:Uncharacterized protein n=1 Tax=Daphnia pulex TaxID=6669 RepID=E9FSY2_DAPPU|nr:hypothetical protein DAPPUDRAFT_233010 [Daphnia pulex]|eukprot:EFX89269.1 hypothetical protein DAPPUDRAFT_233010 [Daphnia pulex]